MEYFLIHPSPHKLVAPSLENFTVAMQHVFNEPQTALVFSRTFWFYYQIMFNK